MTSSRFTTPLDYLQAVSRASLQSYELTRLNHAANLRAEIAALLDRWVQETTEALLARWMLDHHKSLQPVPMTSAEIVQSLIDPAAALPLPKPASAPSRIPPAPPRFAAARSSMRSSSQRKQNKQEQSAAG